VGHGIVALQYKRQRSVGKLMNPKPENLGGSKLFKLLGEKVGKVFRFRHCGYCKLTSELTGWPPISFPFNSDLIGHSGRAIGYAQFA
jgi:hypothetical protein